MLSASSEICWHLPTNYAGIFEGARTDSVGQALHGRPVIVLASCA